MRLAILITGQPRYIDQGSWWLREKVFKHSSIQVDYYCYFWDNGDPDLKNKVSELYNTPNVYIEKYEPIRDELIHEIQTRNKDRDLSNVSIELRENLLFDTPEITSWAKNFYGQYLAAHHATEIFKDQLINYDIVIKTRSDCVMNNMDQRHWHSLLNNMRNNPIFHDKLFADWLYVKAGQPYHGDYVFAGTPDQWIKYASGIGQALVDMCTINNHWWNECEYSDIIPAHWVWNRINYYTKNDWLSISVVWPTPFSCTLLRSDGMVYNNDYDNIKRIYDSNK